VGDRAIREDSNAPRALQIASGLHSAGVGRGELVSLLLPPGPARTAVAYACWRIGAVVVATSTELTLRECEQAHRQARPGVIIANGPGLALTRAARSPWLRLAVGRLLWHWSGRQDLNLRPLRSERGPQFAAVPLSTGGGVLSTIAMRLVR
jgi:hypothetical protein